MREGGERGGESVKVLAQDPISGEKKIEILRCKT